MDLLLLLILWKPKHQIFMVCWSFHWDLKSNLCPLLVQCVCYHIIPHFQVDMVKEI